MFRTRCRNMATTEIEATLYLPWDVRLLVRLVRWYVILRAKMVW